MAESAAATAPPLEEIQERVLDVIQALAVELGGERARNAVGPTASLERDVGLGSLERVELLLRLESTFGRALDDACLSLDTAADLAHALLAAGETATVGDDPLALAAVAVPTAATPAGEAATLHESLWRRAEAAPERAHVFMREEDGSERTISYGALLSESAGVAGGLREAGVRRGDRVALMLPTGSDFLRSFQGILLAGAIPVPIYPPLRLDRLQEYAERQAGILADAEAVLLITITRALPIADVLRPRVPGLQSVTTVGALLDLGASWAAPEGNGSDPAFIQYTSGSTGEPKGVLLSHDNLLANIRAIAAGLRAVPSDVGASWLPLYHDMGLIGSWLFCLHHGYPLDIQSPLAFLARPERWLRAIHRRRATLSAAPNFAYELCARRIPEAALEGLDLSSWRCALNGAEPVNPDTLERFTARFAPYGFRREAFMPVYGLAESSVALCFPPLGRGPRVDRVGRSRFELEQRALPSDESSALRFVSVGQALPLHEVRIVADSGAEVPERSVGRLVFRGPSSMQGYFRKPEATAAMGLDGGWLDSGDLAYAADGEIFIAGRLKDLIIKAGRNLVPQEIEEAVAEVRGVRKGGVAAFGVPLEAQGTESLVVVAETRIQDAAARERLCSAITERVATALGIPPDVVALVPPGAVSKTSSGKIRRAATKALYLTGELGRGPQPSLAARLRTAVALGRGLGGRALARGVRLLYGAYAALALLPLAALAWVALTLSPAGRPVRRAERRLLRWLLRVLGCRFQVSGVDQPKAGGPWIFVANHASYADVPAVRALLDADFLFLAKREVSSWPLIGGFVRKGRHILVDRADVQDGLAAADSAEAALKRGESVLVFPEATFSPTPGLRSFRLGAFMTAARAGIPVVPLALQGTRSLLRDGTRIPRPGRLELWIGPPLHAEGTSWREVVELRDRARGAIAAHCGEPLLTLVAAGPKR
jgi:1-acyl-sn-glycerol-3-phosphate acyltransferase